MKKETKILGDHGETIIANYLQEAGFTILVRNYRTSRGEIDIIAQRGDTISFIEVKTRKTIFFDISQVITPLKQKKMIHVAKSFISQHQSLDQQQFHNFVLQFDIAILEHNQENSQKNSGITYISNAFCGIE